MSLVKLVQKILIAFFILQTTFSLFYEFFTGQQNIYPLYTWRIFHTQPDKILSNNEIYVHQIDNQIFDPPQKGVLFVETTFPQVKIYTFSKKLQDYTGSSDQRDKVIQEINRLFTKDHPHQKVVWEISTQTFNPIDFYWKNQLISETFLGKHVAE